jgi:hypothetical protein
MKKGVEYRRPRVTVVAGGSFYPVGYGVCQPKVYAVDRAC